MSSTFLQTSFISAHTMTNILSFIGDFLIIFILFAVVFIFSRVQSRERFVAFIISLYIGYALYVVVPFTYIFTKIPVNTITVADIVLFLLFSFISYNILCRITNMHSSLISNIGTVILSFLTTGFLLALAYHVLPIRNIYTFTPAIDTLFAAKTYFFLWFIAPITGLLLLA